LIRYGSPSFGTVAVAIGNYIGQIMNTTPNQNIAAPIHQSGILLFFASHPFLSAVGSICSAVSVPLALFLYFVPHERRQLYYSVAPNRSIVVNRDSASQLKASFDGKEITDDITIAQLVLWNDGNSSIKPEHVLEQLAVKVGDGNTAILDAVIRKQSRNAIGFGIGDPLASRNGILPLAWKILEGGDGALIQITYAGGPDVPIQVTGTVEGQKQIKDFALATRAIARSNR
jgi:hypothetical protein